MLKIGTINVFKGLSRKQARAAVQRMLDEADAFGVQEWRRGPSRAGLLRRHGRKARRPLRGGGPVSVRKSRFDLLKVRTAVLHPAGPVDKPPHGKKRRRRLGKSKATLGFCYDRVLEQHALLINFHLTAGVQRGKGEYRHDQPLRVVRHRRERRALEDLADRYRRKGWVVYAVGDTNFHGLRLKGFTSCWQGNANIGTLGHRAVDCVFAPEAASDVETYASDSDHKAVVATYFE